MEFLPLFLRHHLMGKPVLVLPNVSCFFRLEQNSPVPLPLALHFELTVFHGIDLVTICLILVLLCMQFISLCDFVICKWNIITSVYTLA